ncbi:hypothetical protein, partial [Streptomyces sp. NPDC005476]|uniref:hypothetical protein n=1 Tax=Streptomyces sp. NPDC005476 TaxID=3156882 RepID=UPI0034567B29
MNIASRFDHRVALRCNQPRRWMTRAPAKVVFERGLFVAQFMVRALTDRLDPANGVARGTLDPRAHMAQLAIVEFNVVEAVKHDA